ncbi:MAG: UTP--glucose-1-phosphate uridylyltransferase GalU [Bacillota bacterium]|nr:UTP--glucose-1-phosphate uridylyltransferase GalU [Bacillota bacterium]
MPTVRKAVIPAAGLGTRFLPATKAQPKEMLPIVDAPAIQYVVEEIVEAGIEDVLIVTSANKGSIEDYFDRSLDLEAALANKEGKAAELEMVRRIGEMASVHYVRQKQPLGLGHAVLCARMHVGDEPFAVLLPDDLIRGEPSALRQLLEVAEPGTSVVAVQPVPEEEVSRYGVIDGRPLGRRSYSVQAMVEKPKPGEAPSNLAIIGRYVLDAAVFGVLEKLPPGHGGEIQLTDALRVLAGEGRVRAREVEGERFDVGDRLGWLTANLRYALDRPDLAPALLDFLEATVERARPAGGRA